ncbi:MAG: hypothetical protein OEQ18_12425, partial [Gammaproteobacteria bacterium]|nr:hypothetical protein [Gammaproteobacteria bacterium]
MTDHLERKLDIQRLHYLEIARRNRRGNGPDHLRRTRWGNDDVRRLAAAPVSDVNGSDELA